MTEQREKMDDNIERSLYKGKINIIDTKILAHYDYGRGKETIAFFCKM